MKESFVTWQLQRLHDELESLDQRTNEFKPALSSDEAKGSARRTRTTDTQRTLLDRVLRSLPRRLGFRDARAFALAFARANCLIHPGSRGRRRLTPTEIRELERRVLNHESPAEIAMAIGCAEQTVLNRASQFRKQIAAQAEADASGI